MGAWGYEIFGNDDACDVQDRFQRYMREGLSVAEATEACINWWPDCVEDMNALLALAALQMERKGLQPKIKTKCLQLIDEKREVTQWNDPEKRIRVLEAFRNRLIQYRY